MLTYGETTLRYQNRNFKEHLLGKVTYTIKSVAIIFKSTEEHQSQVSALKISTFVQHWKNSELIMAALSQALSPQARKSPFNNNKLIPPG